MALTKTKTKREVPVELLDECFLYEQSTGELYWKERPLKHFCSEHQQKIWNKRFSGKRAGSIHGRYRVVCVNGVRMFEHRVVLALYLGVWPSAETDHINRNGHDNRLNNLRVVDRGTNCSNREFRRSKLGVTGVKQDGQKFITRKQVNGIRVYLGTFDSIKEAKLAYDAFNGRNG